MNQIVSGKIYQIDETVQVSEKFSKRDFVLEISNDPAYIQKVLFTATRDKVNLLDNFSKGDEVTVKFNLKGKDWTSPQGDVKFFNTLEAYDISGSGSNKVVTKNENELRTKVEVESADDDLPF